MKILISILLLLPQLAFANELFKHERIGSFVFFHEVPKTLFLFDDIENEDSFAFRSAVRKHDVDTMVLSSPGGSVYEGLQISGIISDLKINTFIPSGGNCESACSFLFFAGKYRYAAGKLGVHQFSSNNKSAGNVSDTEEHSQYTAAEIISYLNFYETPPFVFEKMFGTASNEMYFFPKQEVTLLNVKSANLERRAINVTTFLSKVEAALNSQSDNVAKRKEFNWPHRSSYIPKKIIWKKSRDYGGGLHCYDPERKIVFKHQPYSMTTCGGVSYPISKEDYSKIIFSD